MDEGWLVAVLAIKEDVLVTMAGCKLGWPPLTASGMNQSPVLGREEAHSIDTNLIYTLPGPGYLYFYTLFV